MRGRPLAGRIGAFPPRVNRLVPLPDHWFIACRSDELGPKPIARTVQGVPLALFRAESGRAAALVDRCPHRNVPLSFGHVRGELLECRYHGWSFDASGACCAIPGLRGDPGSKGRRAQSHAAREEDGFVWVYSTPDVEPRRAPFRFPHLADKGYTSVRRAYRIEASMLAVAENALDVPHTAFLHGGLFRTRRKANEIAVVIRRYGDRAEAEFIGEPRPPGVAGRILAPRGGVVTHFDRFLLPSIAQVEYRLGDASHLVTTSALTPVTDEETILYAMVTFRLPIPSWLVRPFITPIAGRIMHQDMEVLDLMTANVRRFGGEHFAHTEIDVLGPQMARLVDQAAKGEAGGEGLLHEHRVRMLV